MKKQFFQFAPLLAPVLAAAFLSSCVESGYPGDYRATASGHGVYTTLPNDYVGSAYYYNGRYYAGGRYQSGRYHYQGRAYDNRYVYNGQYFYGGRYQQHGSNSPRHDSRHDSRYVSRYDSRYDPRREQDGRGYRVSSGPPREYDHTGYQSPAGYRRGGLYRISSNPYR